MPRPVKETEVIVLAVRIMYSSSLYPREAVIGAAYALTDGFYVHLGMDNGSYIMELSSKNGEDTEEDAKNKADNEMVFQLARFTVYEKTKDIRRIMLARAFASSVLDDGGDIPDYAEGYAADAEKILRDWFDKNE